MPRSSDRIGWQPRSKHSERNQLSKGLETTKTWQVACSEMAYPGPGTVSHSERPRRAAALAQAGAPPGRVLGVRSDRDGQLSGPAQLPLSGRAGRAAASLRAPAASSSEKFARLGPPT
eukprot:464606-Hanusia_phi.AAC.1